MKLSFKSILAAGAMTLALTPTVAMACGNDGTTGFRSDLSGPFSIVASTFVFEKETLPVNKTISMDVHEFIQRMIGNEWPNASFSQEITNQAFPNGTIDIPIQGSVDYTAAARFSEIPLPHRLLETSSDFSDLEAKKVELETLVCQSDVQNNPENPQVNSMEITDANVERIIELGLAQLSFMLDNGTAEAIWTQGDQAGMRSVGINRAEDVKPVFIEGVRQQATIEDTKAKLKHYLREHMRSHFPTPSPVAGAEFTYMNKEEATGFVSCGGNALRDTIEVSCSDSLQGGPAAGSKDDVRR